MRWLTTPIAADDVGDLARLVVHDALVGNEHRLRRLGREAPHVAEHARREEAVGILHHGARADRAGACIERVVEELDACPSSDSPSRPAAGCRPSLPSATRPCSRLYFSSADSGASKTKRIGSSVTIVVSTRRAGLHEVAGREPVLRDAARRAAPSTRVNSRLSSLACTFASAAATSAAACRCWADSELHVGLADEVALAQRLAALERRIRIRLRGLGPRELSPGLRELRLRYGRGSMTKSSCPLLHVLPVAEVHGLQHARDARADFHGIHRLETAGVVVPVAHLPDDGGRRPPRSGSASAGGGLLPQPASIALASAPMSTGQTGETFIPRSVTRTLAWHLF